MFQQGLLNFFLEPTADLVINLETLFTTLAVKEKLIGRSLTDYMFKYAMVDPYNQYMENWLQNDIAQNGNTWKKRNNTNSTNPYKEPFTTEELNTLFETYWTEQNEQSSMHVRATDGKYEQNYTVVKDEIIRRLGIVRNYLQTPEDDKVLKLCLQTGIGDSCLEIIPTEKMKITTHKTLCVAIKYKAEMAITKILEMMDDQLQSAMIGDRCGDSNLELAPFLMIAGNYCLYLLDYFDMFMCGVGDREEFLRHLAFNVMPYEIFEGMPELANDNMHECEKLLRRTIKVTNIDAQDRYNRTAFHIAVQVDNTAAATILQEMWARDDIKDQWNNTVQFMRSRQSSVLKTKYYIFHRVYINPTGEVCSADLFEDPQLRACYDFPASCVGVYSRKDLKRIRRRLALQYHPDKNEGGESKDFTCLNQLIHEMIERTTWHGLY